jgi:hypothetical protein
MWNYKPRAQVQWEISDYTGRPNKIALSVKFVIDYYSFDIAEYDYDKQIAL